MWIRTLTRSSTPHRVGPPAEESVADADLRSVLLPLAVLDGELWGSGATIGDGCTSVTAAAGASSTGSTKLTDVGIDFTVNQNARFHGRHLRLRQHGAPTAVPMPGEEDDNPAAVRIPAEPQWVQDDEN